MTDDIRRDDEGNALCWVPYCDQTAHKHGDPLRPAPCRRHAGATSRPVDAPSAWRQIA